MLRAILYLYTRLNENNKPTNIINCGSTTKDVIPALNTVELLVCSLRSVETREQRDKNEQYRSINRFRFYGVAVD